MKAPWTLPADVVEAILAAGYAKLRLNDQDSFLLHQVLRSAPEFFGRDLVEKLRHAGVDANFGFRQMGIEYSEIADRPDVNESFTVWSNRVDLIPNHSAVGPLLEQVDRWQERLRDIVAEVLAQFVKALDGHLSEPLEFARASHVQVNCSSAAPAEREFLQDCHEDGHLLTFMHATDAGLEINCTGSAEPIDFRSNELLVMPGSVLSLVSDRRIGPLFHQVRNLGVVGRLSVMYFVNPDVNRPVFGWSGSGSGAEDLRGAIRDRPTEFGLPSVPAL